MNVVTESEALARRLHGLLLGTAVGDSLGLPAEGLSPRRIARRWPGPLRHRFLAGRGMVSDDTEHTWLVGQSLLVEPRDAERFARRLAGKLRLWLLGLPAGVGLATLRAILRLWIGFPPGRSGVRSAGNGAAMRAGLFGVFFADNPGARRRFVEASSRITHTDPRALAGAWAVARAAAAATAGREVEAGWFGGLESLAGHSDWRAAIRRARQAAARREEVSALAEALGGPRGVSGYVCQSVPLALFAWWRHRGDFRATVESCVIAGGDTDTTGAIAGGLAGADVGVAGIPAEWRAGLREWPRTPRHFGVLTDRLAAAALTGEPQAPVRYCWPGLAVRNAVFLAAVLGHGCRRAFPPW